MSQSPDHDNEVIRISELVEIIWSGKWLIVTVTIAAIVVATIVSLMLPNIYRAEALLAPNQGQGNGALSNLTAQYGGLASLAGINIGNSDSGKTALGLEILKSRKFISDFITRHDILVPLMAADGWDPETGKIRIDSDQYDIEQKQWIRKVRPPKQKMPSLQEAYEEFRDNVLTLTESSQTGLVTLAVDHPSPVIAKEWVEWLIKDINSTVMRQDVEEAKQAIEYLNRQIESTSLAELQNVFFSLIEEQTKTVMLASISEEYLLKTIDPAVEPEEKIRPRRAIIVLVSAFLAAGTTVFAMLIFGIRRDNAKV